MKISSVWGVLFACILALITISVDAVEGVAYTPDNANFQQNDTHQVMTEANRAAGKSHHAPAGSSLDVVFVLSNALLGFLLLRRVNKS